MNVEDTQVTPLIFRAATFAATKHSKQYRGSATGEKVPYITHPLRVAAALAEHGVTDEATLAAALLHDTLEDTTATYEELVKEFGSEVADVVAELTDAPGLTSAEGKAAQAKKAPHMSWRAKLVKVADKIDNVASVVDAPWKDAAKHGYVETAERVVEACGDITHAEMKVTFAATAATTRAALA